MMYRDFGLALSGGGMRGIAHLGVLKALDEEGIGVGLISGTSVGSIFAGLYACRLSYKDMERAALSVGREILDADIRGLAKGLFSLIMRREPSLDGIIKGDRLSDIFKELTHGIYIKSLAMPIAITGVDINDGQTVIYTNRPDKFRGQTDLICESDVPLYKAIRASIAIPMVFKPIHIKGRRMVDGGVTIPFPVKAVRSMGSRHVLGVNLGYAGDKRPEVDNILEIGMQSISIMGYRINQMEATGANLVLLPKVVGVRLNDVDKIPYCIDTGYKIARKNMNMIKKMLIQH